MRPSAWYGHCTGLFQQAFWASYIQARRNDQDVFLKYEDFRLSHATGNRRLLANRMVKAVRCSATFLWLGFTIERCHRTVI